MIKQWGKIEASTVSFVINFTGTNYILITQHGNGSAYPYTLKSLALSGFTVQHYQDIYTDGLSVAIGY